MRCHYEVLGVPLDVDTTTLRAAYKKCALRWHPDKNLDNVDEAKKEFQSVQQAFEVLSDPQERAWYDRHREAILKGGFGEDYVDDSLNLFPFFSASCYEGYGDDEKGFYSVYREVFHKIYAEDFTGQDCNDDSNIPSFGNSTSTYEEVIHPFYAYWENYCTTKTFVWLDEYDIREAPNRRVVRLMEKENKKVRDKARKERNEEIRTLVKFVRKRDKRLQKHRKCLEEKAAENAKKAQLNRIRQLEERKKEIAESKEADWSKMTNVESELKEIEANLASEFGDNGSEEISDAEDDAEIMLSHLYCVACSKMFKNEKSFANHENSRKHKDNVAAIKLTIENDDIVNDPETEKEIISGIEDMQLDEDVLEEECSSVIEETTSKKKNKGKKVLKPMEEFVCSLDSVQNNDDGYENDFTESKKQKKKNTRRKTSNQNPTTQEVKSKEAVVPEPNSVEEDSLKDDQESSKTQKEIDKKPKGKKNTDKQNIIPSTDSKDLICAVCQKIFPSKNKLFNHLKTTGHSIPIPKNAAAKEKVSKSKNRDFKSS